MTNKKYGLSASQIYRFGFKLCLEVYERYNQKCCNCGEVNGLCIHHIDGSGDAQGGNKLSNNSLDNLQLLCRSCHMRIHANIRWGNDISHKGNAKLGRQRYYQNNKEKWKQYDKNRREWKRAYGREYAKKNRVRLNKLRYNRRHNVGKLSNDT